MQIAYTSLDSDGPINSRVFDTDQAEEFEGDDPAPRLRVEGTAWNVGMYLTREGRWVVSTLLIRSAEKGGSGTVYMEVDGDRAHEFLKKYHHLEAAQRYFERPKGGRPKIGDRLITTVPARMHNEIADLAEMYAEDMPETVRRLLGEALEHRRIIGAPGSRPDA
jgi:hypothetical protein